MRITRAMFVGVLIAALGVLAGCKTKTTTVRPESSGIAVDGPASVGGNVVSLTATPPSGVTIVKADGDTSGKTGHWHVFIDREPVAAGAVIPKEAGIVHSAANPIVITGLSVGSHTFRIVLGDGTHMRIGDAEGTKTVEVKGPSIDASAPATLAAGAALPVTVKVDGITLVKADGDTTGKTGHLHVLVDVAPVPGAAIAKVAGIIHTTETSISVPGLTAGEHTIWVVVGDGTHVPLAPPVEDKVTVTVS